MVLVVYASLYPFQGWRHPGAPPWDFLWAPWPKYWTTFDVASNLLGYAALGFGLALAWLRSGASAWSWWLSWLLSALLSLLVESLQSYLPMRVASRLDLVVNILGALLGASLAWGMAWLGALRRWSEVREHWFIPKAHGSLVLLALWPAALLYPTSIPFGLGQIRERLEAWGVVFWWEPVAMTEGQQVACVAMGLLAPMFMGLADVRLVWRRIAFVGLLLAAGLTLLTLSSALTYGPDHLGAWITPVVMRGAGLALLLALALVWIPRWLAHVLMLTCLVGMLCLLNRSVASAYLAQSLAIWEQGRFIRFHGLSQWLGWIWPLAALVFGARALASRAHALGTST